VNSQELIASLEGYTLPRHIAVIMDGNGRWARQRGLPRLHGHLEGRVAAKRCVALCVDLGIEALSMYAFSSENWRRPEEEVRGIMSLLEASIREETDELVEANIQLRASGRLHELPQSLREAIEEACTRTAGNTGMVLNLLINYGGRTEIVDAARRLAAEAAAGRLDPQTIDEATFASALYAPDLPDPDLIIRPGGEMRISNFLLWEVAYSEMVVLPVLWPDFSAQHLRDAIIEFNHRQRRFGGVVDR
jgi:undecaprenyl diphosphate synthase